MKKRKQEKKKISAEAKARKQVFDFEIFLKYLMAFLQLLAGEEEEDEAEAEGEGGQAGEDEEEEAEP